MPDEIAVVDQIDTSVPDATGDSTATPVDATTTPAADTQTDANDPYSLLEQAMNSQLPEDAPADPAQPADANTIPPEFQGVLGISEFVKQPAHVEQAIRAADEVWKVSAGQASATSLLEGIRGANPQGYEKVVRDLIPYLEQVTGQKFGANPDAPPDPRDQRLSALEQRYQQEQQQREQAAYMQQVGTARNVATEFLAKSLKGTFAEGNEAFVLAQCAGKAGIPEQQMVQRLLSGDTKPLEAALKAVQREETARLKKYNENLVKQYRTLKNSVPGVKGASGAKGGADDEAYLPGETAVQYATRRFNAGK